MGQPNQGQFAQGQVGSPLEPIPPRRSRAGIWIALACAVLVVVVLLLAVTGGVVYLATRGGSSQDDPTAAAMTQHSGEVFSVQYPATWFVSESGEDAESAGLLLELGDVQIAEDEYDEFATNSLTVYLFDSTLHAQKECEMQSSWIGFGWDEVDEPTALDPVTLDGRELVAYRALGSHDDQDAAGEMYCADVGTQVMQIVVETHGATELSSEITAILDSWTWTSAE